MVILVGLVMVSGRTKKIKFLSDKGFTFLINKKRYKLTMIMSYICYNILFAYTSDTANNLYDHFLNPGFYDMDLFYRTYRRRNKDYGWTGNGNFLN